MTPEDFVRSITPDVIQPEGLGLDQFKKFDPKKDRVRTNLDPDSIFYKLGASHGLISFTDYVFLLTVLSTSPRHFAIAFKMFDLNGDGELDYNEFERVEALIRGTTTTGARHRNHTTTGSTIKSGTDSALASYFFGPDRSGKLTIERFLGFQEQLSKDILWIEFNRREPQNGRISEVQFGEMLLMHSRLPEKKQKRMLKRVRKMMKKEQDCEGISFADVLAFFRFLSHIGDVDTALTFYHMAGASVDPSTLRHVAKTVAGVDIRDDVIRTVFRLFDENQDGELSNKEFVSVMKRRLQQGLEKPKDTGVVKLLMAIVHCAKQQTSSHR
jgi:Ca2+-binding EF-hand superfamily protein